MACGVAKKKKNHVFGYVKSRTPGTNSLYTEDNLKEPIRELSALVYIYSYCTYAYIHWMDIRGPY